MNELLVFLQTYGWQLALIALAGIIILGVLKYCNVFKKFDEKTRHILYLVISVGISVIGAVIYLACIHQLTIEFACVVAGAILALNQTFYAIYDTTTLKDLVLKLLDWIKGLISSKGKKLVDEIKEDTTEEKQIKEQTEKVKDTKDDATEEE